MRTSRRASWIALPSPLLPKPPSGWCAGVDVADSAAVHAWVQGVAEMHAHVLVQLSRWAPSLMRRFSQGTLREYRSSKMPS